MDADARIEALESENGRLRARIDQLEAVSGHGFLTPVEWRLTPHEMRVLGVLMAREMATKDAIMAALYWNTGKDEPDIKIVDVFVCKLRGKLKPFGFAIETRWGHGYSLTGETKAAVKAAIGASIDGVAA